MPHGAANWYQRRYALRQNGVDYLLLSNATHSQAFTSLGKQTQKTHSVWRDLIHFWWNSLVKNPLQCLQHSFWWGPNLFWGTGPTKLNESIKMNVGRPSRGLRAPSGCIWADVHSDVYLPIYILMGLALLLVALPNSLWWVPCTRARSNTRVLCTRARIHTCTVRTRMHWHTHSLSITSITIPQILFQRPLHRFSSNTFSILRYSWIKVWVLAGV